MDANFFLEYVESVRSVMCDYCKSGLTSTEDDSGRPMGRVTLECRGCGYYTLNKGNVMGKIAEGRHPIKVV